MEIITQEGALSQGIVNQINTNFRLGTVPFGNVYYVDGDTSVPQGDGSSSSPFATIQKAVTAASPFDTIYVKARKMAAGATDPVNYAEVVTIPPGKSGLRLIGYGFGPGQGAIPQVKPSTGSTAILFVRSPGCLIQGLGFNMGSTRGGVYLDESASTYTAFGTIVRGCHFKNNGNKTTAGGGGVFWGSVGGAWQVIIEDNHFYNCCTGINLLGTGSSVPLDVVIRRNYFSSSANTVVDADIAIGAGGGMTGVVVDSNVFATVDVPAKSAGTTARYVDMTACNGILSNNYFACVVSGTGIKTFKAAGSGALIPTTVRMAGNQGECASDGSTTEIIRSA